MLTRASKPTRRRASRTSTDPAKAVGYLRVSTEDQREGLEAQRAALVRWCDANGVELVAEYVGHGISGGAPLDKRPALLEAVEALAEHGAGVLLVAKRDRLARDTMAAAMIERLTERAGARIVSADGVGSEDTPEGLLMRRLIDAFAEYERAVIGARTRAALATKRNRGERVGQIPYGYTLAGDGVRLEQDPTEQRIVALVLALRAEGLTLRAVGEALADAGYKPRGRARRWHPQTVANIERGAGRMAA